jgi:EmrB/QacA subfamily drug resistance transporter
MVVLDTLVVITALPSMQRDLQVGLSTLQWTMNAYGIAFAAGIITAAAVGDRLGRRRVFVWGVALFSIASAACAFAPGASELIAARAAQGLGGAMVLPLSLTILMEAFPVGRRGAIVGIYGGLAGLAVASGPLIGGAVTEGPDWHWVFWINVPIGVTACLLSLRLLPESHGPSGRLDLAGVTLITGAVVSLVWGLVRAGDVGWASAEAVATLAIAVALVVGFFVVERRSPQPMLPLGLLRIRAFAAGNVASLLMGASFAAGFLIVQYFQFALGYTPLVTGARLFPYFVTPPSFRRSPAQSRTGLGIGR